MKIKFKIKYFASGVTLIELLVSMSVIVFMTAIFVNNYQSTNKRTDLIMSGQALVADFHQAQNNALGLLMYGDVVPAGGWGISFDLNNNHQYILFADLDAPGESGYRYYDPATEGIISKGARVIQFSPEMGISALRFPGNVSKTKASVTFLPPDPRTFITSELATSTELEIDIKELKNNTIKTIKVNFLGLAEVIN